MIRKILVRAGDGRLGACEFLRFEVETVSGQDELRLRFPGRRTRFECSQRLRHLTGVASQDVNVACLENSAEVRFVRCACAQAFYGGLLVAEGFKKGIGKARSIKRLFGKLGNCLFYLYGVQLFAPFGLTGVLGRGAAASPLCSATYSRMNCRST